MTVDFDKIFSGVPTILNQTVSIINNNLTPQKETAEATDLVSDAKDIVDKTFNTVKPHLPCLDAAYRAAYDHTQGVSRLMKLYTYSRADFYDIFTENNETMKNQLAQYKAICKKLEKQGEEAYKAYAGKDE